MSTIVTDTLQGKTSATSITLPTTTNIGSTPLVSASANSMTIRGEGSATTNIQQGVAKCWANIDMQNNNVRDSFNLTGVTDNGTGRYELDFSNNFSNNDFLKMAQRLPASWEMAYKAYPFLSPQNKAKFKDTNIDYAWMSIEKDESQKLIKEFFSKYKALKNQIDKTQLSPAAKKHLDKFMPFF